MEKLLHYIWKHQILPLKTLKATNGKMIEIIDPGCHNHNQGPDFFNAKVRIDGTIWAGNIEVHLKSSDWNRHGHHHDPQYNNTILHVVEKADEDVWTADKKQLTQLQLNIPEEIALHYNELCQSDEYPRCHRMIPHLEPLKAHNWLDALLVERMKEKTDRLWEKVCQTKGDWEKATFVTLCRNFGFGLNGEAFERWAERIPLQAASKHRNNLFQIESLFLGMAGLIEKTEHINGAEQIQKMQEEYLYLSHKFQLPQPMQPNDWKYLRTRPQNFPHIRIKQLALLFKEGTATTSSLLESTDTKSLQLRLKSAGISAKTCNLILINTVAPLLYAYGSKHLDEQMMQRALDLLENLPPEENRILKLWSSCGLKVDNAADSQALIQLKLKYCNRKDCLRCRFGYEYLKFKG
jgi:hypothetical protein